MNSFYTRSELEEIGFGYVGEDVLISRNAAFYGVAMMSIGSHTRIDDFCVLSGRITIGKHVHLAVGCLLFAGDYGIELADYTGLSSRCAVYAANDDYSGQCMTNPTVPDRYRNVTGAPVVLQKHVVVGSGTTILPGVTIGEGSSVGSMSLVKRSLDSWGIYFGIPCRFYKERGKALLEQERQLSEEEME